MPAIPSWSDSHLPVTDGSPSSPDARGRGALRALLEVRGFAPLTVGFGLSELVDSMAAVGLVLFLLQYFHDPALAGFLLAARSVPRLLTGLFAGIWLDRVRRRTRLIALDLLVGGSVLLLLPVLARTGHLSIAGLAMLLALAGATAPLNLTGFRSLTPSLVPLPLLSRANAVDSVLGDSGAIVGPAIAAAMVSLFGASGAVTAQGILSLLAAAMVLRVPDLHQPAARSVRSALVTVGDQLLRNRALQATIANMSLGYVGFGILQLTLPLIAEQRFHTGGQSAGLLWAALSAGSVAGALVYGALRPRGSDALHMVAGTALIGPPAPRPRPRPRARAGARRRRCRRALCRTLHGRHDHAPSARGASRAPRLAVRRRDLDQPQRLPARRRGGRDPRRPRLPLRGRGARRPLPTPRCRGRLAAAPVPAPRTRPAAILTRHGLQDRFVSGSTQRCQACPALWSDPAGSSRFVVPSAVCAAPARFAP